MKSLEENRFLSSEWWNKKRLSNGLVSHFKRGKVVLVLFNTLLVCVSWANTLQKSLQTTSTSPWRAYGYWLRQFYPQPQNSVLSWLRQFYPQPQNSVLSWLRQFHLQPQNSVLSNLRLVSYFVDSLFRKYRSSIIHYLRAFIQFARNLYMLFLLKQIDMKLT